VDDTRSLYVIRDAAFGRDFTPKLVLVVLALVLVAVDRRSQRRWDYLWVFVTGTLLLGAAEAALAWQSVRDMPERVLLGRPLPLPASYLVQGAAEGAFLAVAGLFVGDRLLVRDRRAGAVVLLVATMALAVLGTLRSAARLGASVGEVGSRRDVLSPGALLTLTAVAVLVAVFAWRWPRWRPRLAAMAGVVLLIASAWTLAQVAVGGRWVEVGAAGSYERAGAGLTAGVLVFDVLVEIVLACLPFLVVPVMLRLLRDPRPLPSVAPAALARPDAATASP
jgi:hypothetical protein